MANDIEFLVKPTGPIDPKTLLIRIETPDFSDNFGAKDHARIEEYWQEVEAWARLQQNGYPAPVFSRPGSLGTLHDISDGVCTFRQTEFKHYAATALSYDNLKHGRETRPLSGEVYDQMRVGSVGVALHLSDGYVLVQRRARGLFYLPNMLDASVGGFGMVKNGTLDFEANMRKKLDEELRMTARDIACVKLTAIHSGRTDCHSGMWDYAIETPLTRKDIDQRVNKSRIGECLYVHREELPAFVVERYAGEQADMHVDGCGTLLASMDEDSFVRTARELGTRGTRIAFGDLKKGKFIETGIIAPAAMHYPR